MPFNEHHNRRRRFRRRRRKPRMTVKTLARKVRHLSKSAKLDLVGLVMENFIVYLTVALVE